MDAIKGRGAMAPLLLMIIASLLIVLAALDWVVRLKSDANNPYDSGLYVHSYKTITKMVEIKHELIFKISGPGNTNPQKKSTPPPPRGSKKYA